MSFFQFLKKSLFFRQVVILSSGTALAQIIAIAFLPILTRLYSPQDFGIFALYIALASPLFILAIAGYKELIMLPHSHKVAAQLVRIIFFTSIIVSLLSFFIALVFGQKIAKVLGSPEIEILLYFMPLSILFFANYQSLRFWFMRFERFGVISIGQIIKTSTNMFIAIMFKIAKITKLLGAGLVFATIISEFINALWLILRCGKKDKVLFEHIKIKKLITVAKKYEKMAASLTFSQIVSALYTQLPNFIIGAFFGIATLGLYNIAERIASAPALLIANAVGDVYRQRAVAEYRRKGHFDRLMIKAMLALICVAIIPYTIGILFAPDIFSFMLGSQWEQAGEYASIILIGSFFSFITTPVDKAPVIVGAHKFILIFNILRLILHIIAATLVLLNIFDLISYIIALTSIRIIIYLIMTFRSLHYARGNK